MDDSDIEIDNIFDDNIKIRKNEQDNMVQGNVVQENMVQGGMVHENMVQENRVLGDKIQCKNILGDKTNVIRKNVLGKILGKNVQGKEILGKNAQEMDVRGNNKTNMPEQSLYTTSDTQTHDSLTIVKQKYNLDYSYEKDKIDNSLYDKEVEEISQRLRMLDTSECGGDGHTSVNDGVTSVDGDIITNVNGVRHGVHTSVNGVHTNLNDKDMYTISGVVDTQVLNGYTPVQPHVTFCSRQVPGIERRQDVQQAHSTNVDIDKQTSSHNSVATKIDTIMTNKKLRMDELRKHNLKNCHVDTQRVDLHHIQEEFNKLRCTHRMMLQVRNKLLTLMDKEMQALREEMENEKKKEIAALKAQHAQTLDDNKKEAEFYKQKYEKFKVFCKKKVIDYKNRIDNLYKHKCML